MDPLEYSSDEEAPRRRPFTRSQSEPKWDKTPSKDENSRARRGTSLAPVVEQSSDDIPLERRFSLFFPPKFANEPIAEAGPSRSHQPEPSTSATRDTEYSGTASTSATLSQSVAVTERTWRKGQSTGSDEEYMSLREFMALRPPDRTTCRFCSKGTEEGSLISICKCTNDNRFAHNKCLANVILNRPETQCESCGHKLKLHYAERRTLGESSRASQSVQPTPTAESVSYRAHAARLPPRLRNARCRFCFRVGDGVRRSVCGCTGERQVAHERCLQTQMETHNITRCQSCEQPFRLIEPHVEIMIGGPALTANVLRGVIRIVIAMVQRYLTNRNVIRALYAMSAISSLLCFLYLYIKYQNKGD